MKNLAKKYLIEKLAYIIFNIYAVVFFYSKKDKVFSIHYPTTDVKYGLNYKQAKNLVNTFDCKMKSNTPNGLPRVLSDKFILANVGFVWVNVFGLSVYSLPPSFWLLLAL